MKRPEGFDAPAPADAPDRSRSSARGATTSTEKTTREKKVREKPAREKPVREKPARVRASRAGSAGAEPNPRPSVPRPSVPRPSADRTAAAELRAAERARKRHERRELKRFTRRTRQRRIAWLTGIGTVAMLVLLSLGAAYSPLLALRDIQVDGTSRLDPAQLVDAVDGQIGVPFALLDESRIRDELGEFTLIRSYTTELLPPGTLIIHIVERAPIGSISRGAQFDLVDAAGVVIASTPERTPGMPVITVADDDVESAAFRSVAAVLLSLPPEFLAQVDGVTATTRDDVTLVLTGSNQRVEWGSAEGSDHKARVLAALVAIHGGSGPGLYDVSAPGSAVFRAD